MKIWHFITILVLIAIPSSGTWLYYDSQRQSDDAGLFGHTKVKSQPAPIPPIFWEDSIDVEIGTPILDLEEEITFEDAGEQMKNEVFKDVLESLDDPASDDVPEPNANTQAEDSPTVKRAIPVEVEEDELIEP